MRGRRVLPPATWHGPRPLRIGAAASIARDRTRTAPDANMLLSYIAVSRVETFLQSDCLSKPGSRNSLTVSLELPAHGAPTDGAWRLVTSLRYFSIIGRSVIRDNYGSQCFKELSLPPRTPINRSVTTEYGRSSARTRTVIIRWLNGIDVTSRLGGTCGREKFAGCVRSARWLIEFQGDGSISFP